jgi:RNA polymerase sigma-70 factor (ECF subfamily)
MEKYRPEQGPFAAWLFAIARNSVNDYLRSQRRHPHIPLDALRFQPNPETQTEEQVVQNETVAEILVAMSQLNERERELLSLKFASGLTNRHIARITRLGEKNVGVILYRAIRRLRDCLETKE